MSFSLGETEAPGGEPSLLSLGGLPGSCLHPGTCPFALSPLTIGWCFILQLTTTAVYPVDTMYDSNQPS